MKTGNAESKYVSRKIEEFVYLHFFKVTHRILSNRNISLDRRIF